MYTITLGLACNKPPHTHTHTHTHKQTKPIHTTLQHKKEHKGKDKDKLLKEAKKFLKEVRSDVSCCSLLD